MQSLPPITRNLLIANVVCFILQELAKAAGTDLTDIFGLHFVLAENFGIWQLVSYMFLHGGIAHLFFNMFSLWMFGGLIERTLGRNRFLLYYFICGVGAGLCQEAVQLSAYYTLGMHLYEYVDTSCGLMSTSAFLNLWTTIGASGACYGVLLAFGMLYPNERIMLLLPPIPMKAKYFVVGYAAIELFSAYFSNDNVAHFAHLGGMLFGWLLLRYWRRQPQPRDPWQQWTINGEPLRKPTLKDRIVHWWNGLGNGKKTKPGNAHRTATRETDYEYNMRKKAEEKRMDEILDKIRLSGYDSLTTEEKQELYRLSRK